MREMLMDYHERCFPRAKRVSQAFIATHFPSFLPAVYLINNFSPSQEDESFLASAFWNWVLGEGQERWLVLPQRYFFLNARERGPQMLLADLMDWKMKAKISDENYPSQQLVVTSGGLVRFPWYLLRKVELLCKMDFNKEVSKSGSKYAKDMERINNLLATEVNPGVKGELLQVLEPSWLWAGCFDVPLRHWLTVLIVIQIKPSVKEWTEAHS